MPPPIAQLIARVLAPITTDFFAMPTTLDTLIKIWKFQFRKSSDFTFSPPRRNSANSLQANKLEKFNKCWKMGIFRVELKPRGFCLEAPTDTFLWRPRFNLIDRLGCCPRVNSGEGCNFQVLQSGFRGTQRGANFRIISFGNEAHFWKCGPPLV